MQCGVQGQAKRYKCMRIWFSGFSVQANSIRSGQKPQKLARNLDTGHKGISDQRIAFVLQVFVKSILVEQVKKWYLMNRKETCRTAETTQVLVEKATQPPTSEKDGKKPYNNWKKILTAIGKKSLTTVKKAFFSCFFCTFPQACTSTCL